MPRPSCLTPNSNNCRIPLAGRNRPVGVFFCKRRSEPGFPNWAAAEWWENGMLKTHRPPITDFEEEVPDDR